MAKLATIILSLLLIGCGNVEEEYDEYYSESTPKEMTIIDFEWDDFGYWGGHTYKMKKLGDPITGEMLILPAIPDSLVGREVKMYGFLKEHDEEEGVFVFQDTTYAGSGWTPSYSEIEVAFEDSTLNVDEFLNTEQYIIGELYLQDYILEHHIKGIEVIPNASTAMRNAKVLKFE